MAETSENFPITREAVASFADQAHFRQAVGDLLTAGFEPSDLSVLAAHESLDVAGGVAGYRKEPHSWLPSGLADEMKYLPPLTIAGIIVLSGDPRPLYRGAAQRGIRRRAPCRRRAVVGPLRRS